MLSHASHVHSLARNGKPTCKILLRAPHDSLITSDVNLLVIMPVTGSKRAKQVEMRVALHYINMPTDIILVTPSDVERERDIVGTIIRPAL